LYAALVCLWVSGGAWAWAGHLDEAGDGGGAWSAVKPWLLKVHGFSAMGFVLLLGTLLPNHVRRAWRAHRNRGNGAIFLVGMSALTLSGYLLYYLGDERWRNATSNFHLWLGLAAPGLLVWHIWAGRRAVLRPTPPSQADARRD
jgi:hypothetical protein